jgi:AcrR family transcriptional regulator
MSQIADAATAPSVIEPPAALTGEDPRSRLLAAALAVVAERGYGATSVTQIAARAEVSRQVFAAHFADKQACYLAAYDATIEWLGEGIERALAERGGWPQGVRTAVETTLSLLAVDPRLARLCGMEVLFAGPPALVRHRATVQRLAAALRSGRDHCEWGARLPEQIEETVIGGAIWSIGTRAASAKHERLRELGPDLTYFLLSPYLEIAEAERVATADLPRCEGLSDG